MSYFTNKRKLMMAKKEQPIPVENLYKYSDMESGTISNGVDADSNIHCRTKLSSIIQATGGAYYTIKSSVSGFVVTYMNMGPTRQWLTTPSFTANTPLSFMVPIVGNGMRVVLNENITAASSATVTLTKD